MAKDSNYPELDWGEIDALPDEEKYEKYKAEVQRLFKANKIAGICANLAWASINQIFGRPYILDALNQWRHCTRKLVELVVIARTQIVLFCLMLTPNPEDIFSPKATLDDLINCKVILEEVRREIFHSNSSCLLGTQDIENETNGVRVNRTT